MYSKEDTQRIRKEFWTQFGQQYPRKWLLYNTQIKDFSFKFYADQKKAEVSLDIECKDDELRYLYYQKITSLQTILKEDFLESAQFESEYHLDNGKIISRIWVTLDGVSMNNTKNWEEIYVFFYDIMDAWERFFYEYEDYIRDLEMNS